MTNLLQGRSLFLIGMMGAGKTSVGQLLAKRLAYRFFDTDVLIERVMGQSIPEIFAQQGEAEFRRIESRVLAELSACTCSIIATGGGIVLQPQNWGYLHHGVVVWLDVPVTELQHRLAQDTSRPLLQNADLGAKLEQLSRDRRPLYAHADLCLTVSAGTSPEQVVEHLLEQLPQILKPAAEALEMLN